MLNKFFQPRSVAVIGASNQKGKVGHVLMTNLLLGKDYFKIYPVNPKPEPILGLPAYPTVKDIPDVIDLAIVAIPAKAVPLVIQDCAKKNIKSIIIISAGFKETDTEGYKLEQEILAISRKYNIRLLGPNCLGLINPYHSLNASFATTLPQKGGIAFMSQSGALCTALLDWVKAEQIGFSSFVSLGNKSDINELTLLNYWAEDKNTKVILAYLEGIESGQEFIKVARVVTKKKPVIIVKSGRTSAGAKAISSHTGSLAGSDQAYNAAFKQCGIIRADTVEELFNYGLAFAYQPLPQGERIAILTNAGGPAIMASDAAELIGLQFAALKPETIALLRANLPKAANVHNPVDILGDAQKDRYEFALQTILNDENVDAVVVILTPQAMTEIVPTAEIVSSLAQKFNKTIISCFMGEAEINEAVKILNKNKIPNYKFPERAINTMKKLVTYKQWVSKQIEYTEYVTKRKEAVEKVLLRAKQDKKPNLTFTEVKEILEEYEFQFPRSSLAKTAAEAVKISNEIGYPVVLKISSPDILHKTDIGGVRLNLSSDQAVADAFEAIIIRTQKFFPEAEILGCTVQKMAPEGKEVILGMNRDKQFGPVIMFGLGGIYVEILKDVTFRVAPISRTDAEEMIKEIKGYRLLSGARGEKPVNINTIIDCLQKLSQLSCDFNEILEIDINPLMVYQKDALVIDSRITIEIT